MSEKKEFLYKIQVIRPELLTNSPTPKEEIILEAHFNYLKDLKEKGVVILAGRTLNTDSTGFRIVIFQTDSDDAVQKIMEFDPAVVNRVIHAEPYLYQIALMGKY